MAHQFESHPVRGAGQSSRIKSGVTEYVEQGQGQAFDLAGQVGDVPAVNLIRLGGHQSAWIFDLSRHARQAAVTHLAALVQQAVQR
jgi:hypothetical protein